MTTPFLSHWYVKGPVPDGVTVKLAASPTLRLRACGCPEGGTDTRDTEESWQSALSNEPAALAITTE